ncbi:hypothetical protein ACI6Q2_02850 [Chitinophagaceae bacterium LWZ2-11]
MNLSFLIDNELANKAWNNIRCAYGGSQDLPHAVKTLLLAESVNDAEDAYWKLENVIVVQGQVYQAAEYVMPSLVCALNYSIPSFVKISTYELIFQIINGTPQSDEFSNGNDKIIERCISIAREGLWIYYEEFLDGNKEMAEEILDIIDKDRFYFIKQALNKR